MANIAEKSDQKIPDFEGKKICKQCLMGGLFSENLI
jgi:hypothetical protein